MVARGHAAFDAAAWGARATPRAGKRAKPGARQAAPPPPLAQLQRSASPTRARGGAGAANRGGAARRGIDPDADSIFGARDEDAYEADFVQHIAVDDGDGDGDDDDAAAPQRAPLQLPRRRDAARAVAATHGRSAPPVSRDYGDTSVSKLFAPSGGRSAEAALRDLLASEDAPAALKHYTRGGAGGASAGSGGGRGAAARAEVWDSSDDRDGGRHAGGWDGTQQQQQRSQERQRAQQQQQQQQQQRRRPQAHAQPQRGLERDSFDEDGENALGNYGEFKDEAPRAASPTRRRQQPYAPPPPHQQQHSSYRDDEGGAAWADVTPELASPRMMGSHAAAAAPYGEQQLAWELASAYQIAALSPRPVGQSRLAAAAAARAAAGGGAAAAAYGGANGYGDARPLSASLEEQRMQAARGRTAVGSSYDDAAARARPW
jgi:hypothetical protein